MNNKKANVKGFTLVELIVVMSIFGMIMGALLNLLKPANEVFNNTNAVLESNITGSGVINYMDESLKYATNVLVLRNYPGVPQVTDTGSLGGSAISYKKCIVIDNRNLRGANSVNFTGDNNDTAQKRMGSTGCIISVTDLASGGFSFNNSKVVPSADYYDTFKFDIDAKISNIEDMYTVDVSLDAYQPVAESGTYVFEKTAFVSEASINLKNVNLDQYDSFIVQDYIDFAVDDSELAKYPQATAPADATEGQKLYYNTDPSNTYTYIFYDVKTSADDLSYTITFEYASDDDQFPGQLIDTIGNCKPGTKLTTTNVPTLPLRGGYKTPYWVNEQNKIEDFSNCTITGDTKFVAVYPKDDDAVQHPVIFKSIDGTETTAYQFEGWNASSKAPGADVALNGDETLEFLGWYTNTSDPTTEISNVIIDSANITFYPLYKNKHKIVFMSEGSVYETLYVADGAKIVKPDGTPEKSGYDFDNWYNEENGGGTKFNDTATVHGDLTYYANFVPEGSVPTAKDTTFIVHFVTDGNPYNNIIRVNGNCNLDYSVNGNETLMDSNTVVNYKEICSSKLKAGNTIKIVSHELFDTSGNKRTADSITLNIGGDEYTLYNDGSTTEKWYKNSTWFATEQTADEPTTPDPTNPDPTTPENSGVVNVTVNFVSGNDKEFDVIIYQYNNFVKASNNNAAFDNQYQYFAFGNYNKSQKLYFKYEKGTSSIIQVQLNTTSWANDISPFVNVDLSKISGTGTVTIDSSGNVSYS